MTTRPDQPIRRRVSRVAILVTVGAALVAGCGNPPSPSPSPSAAPSSATPSSQAPSASAAEMACTAADITATGGPWGGAAGSRGSDVVVANGGSAGCLLPASPTIAVVDQAGTVLLSNAPAQAGTGPSIAPGGTIGFSLVIGNWCEQSVNLPLHISLALASETVDIDALTIGTVDELPPCNGPGQPASLSTTDWES